MFQHDESCSHGRHFDQPGLEGVNDRLRRRLSRRDVPIVRIKSLRPNNGLIPQLGRNGSDTVIDIPKGWTPVLGCNANNRFDSLLGPFEFSDDLFVGEGGHGRVGPGVDGDLVAFVVGAFEGLWVGDCARSDDEEGCFLVVGQQVVVQAR